VSAAPLEAVGSQQAWEAVLEVCLPLVAAGLVWFLVHDQLGAFSPGPPYTQMERMALLSAAALLTGWAAARQLVLYGRRAPRTAVGWALAMAMATQFTMGKVVAGQMEGDCSELGGALVQSTALGGSGALCQVGAVPDNTYLPGRLLRPAWEGQLTLVEWAALAFFAGLGAVGLRDRRLLRTRVAARVFRDLVLAPAAGAAGALGSPGVSEARVVACANPTLWGEICGQLYSADKVFEHGEWCLRCCQVFRPVERQVHLKVVSLFTADIDVLNGLERMDTVSWPQGEPMPPDARLSGQERWVALGQLSLPDTVTVAQALAFVHGELEGWSKKAPEEAVPAFELAASRGSRIHGWIWSGTVASRLTYARPTLRCQLAMGPTRLRDLGLDPSEEQTLQLDIGLLPLELRMGFRRSFLDPGRPAVVQNTRQNLWIPVSPPTMPEDAQGLWVPRVEGEAIRTWLSTEKHRAEDRPGSTIPLPHRNADEPRLGQPALRPMDFVRRPVEEEGGEHPGRVLPAEWPGVSISEWKWLEAEQVELLRRESLVLVEGGQVP
jgi:hypothetical protein